MSGKRISASKLGISVGIAGVMVAALVDIPTTTAQSDGSSRGSDGGSGRTFQDDDYRSAAATFVTQVKLTASDAAVDDEFGSSVCISGDTAIVGAPRNDDGGTDSGSLASPLECVQYANALYW